MSHYHEGNVEEMEDDYDMDEPLEEDMDEVDNHGPVDRGSDSDDDEDYEHRQANDKISDTSAEEARSGKDIQGIPWDKLAVTREKYRQTRLEQYKNYENIPNSGEAAMKVSKSTEKGGTYYEFRRNTRSVKSTILHFQLRNLVWATSKHDVYLMSHYSVLHWSALSGVNTEIMNVQGHVAPSEDTANVNTKPTRRYPLASWIAILALITLVGVYIFSLSLKQNGMPFGLKQTNMIENEREKPCHDPSIPETEIPYVHYPTPDTYSRKECACTPVRFFAILSMQRSGSGWFETLLNSHENISSNGEIFSVKERRSNITSITKTLDKLYNLDWFSSAAKNECTAAVGLKWMLNQGLMKHHEEIVDYFNRRGVSAIFLLRKNLLQRYVSILANDHDRNTKQRNGTHKAHVHHRGEADVLAQYKPTIVTKSLIVELKRSDKLAADALVNFKKTRNIVLYYEDVVSNHTKLVDVLDFLKLPKTKLSSRHVKIHTKRLRDHIDNWIDVYNTLKGTQYESFLNDQR